MSIVEARNRRRLALSLNDLEHSLRTRDITRPEGQHQSSSEPSFDSSWHPARPLEPIHPPPLRIDTPPGLPTFGSRRATLLRLEQRTSTRTSSRLRNLLHSQDGHNRHFPTSETASSMVTIDSLPVPSSTPNAPSDQRDLFRRTMAAIGMSRMLDPDPIDRVTSSTPHIPPIDSPSPRNRINLPPWIYMTNTSGPLAQAEDGSYVRGSFGPRSSGHGLGSRQIEDLPMARLAKERHPPAEVPASWLALRMTDASSGGRRDQSFDGAIGPALDDDGNHTDVDEKQSKCEICCEKFCLWFCGVPSH